MINVKKVNDTIVSKSVLPTTKITPQESGMRAIMSAQLNKIKQETWSDLDRLKKELSEKQAELAELATKNSAVDQVLSPQVEKPATLESSVEPPDNTGVSIYRNTLSQADLIEVQMLAVLNNKRVSKGLLPFNSYSEYLEMYGNTPLGPIVNPPAEKVDPLTPLMDLGSPMVDNNELAPVRAQGEVFLIATQGYYLGWNKSRCYIEKTDGGELNILVAGDRLYGDMATMNMIPNKSFRDLTKAEVDSILKGKPSYNDLFKAYSKFQCQRGVKPSHQWANQTRPF
jgi:hypothetical protein